MKHSLQTSTGWYRLMKITFNTFLILLLLTGMANAKSNDAPGVPANKIDRAWSNTDQNAPFEVEIKGTVTDAKGGPLPGVSVKIKGTNIGATTDNQGHYSLKAADLNGTLVFTYIGFSTQELAIAGRNVVNVQLQDNSTALNEVVVIGYGTVKKKDLIGAVSSVKGEEVVKVPSSTVNEALQGKVPGMDITRTNGYAGGGTSVAVRGTRSINTTNSAANTPLYIVDGVQGVDVSNINTNDIQTVDILKDAASTAIYGSRGANGVVIITTKRGTSGKAQISVNSYYGLTQVTEYAQMMSGPQFVDFRRQAYKAVGTWNSPADDSKIFNADQLAAIQKGQYTNWSDLLLHNGAQQDYQVGVSGGSEKTKVYFSSDYYNEKGLLKLDNYDRYTGRLNIDQIINNWLTVGVSSQLAYINNDIRQDPLNQASKIWPIGTAYDGNGNFILKPLNGSLLNPLVDEQPNAWNKNNKTVSVSLVPYIEITPIKGLTVRSNFSANMANNTLGSFFAKNSISGGGSTSTSNITPSQKRFISWENLLTYHKEFGAHSLTFTGVTSYNSTILTSSYSQGSGQLLPSQLYYNLSGATQNLFIGSSYSKQVLLSYTGRLNYAYKGKYLFQFTGREDQSSVLGEGHKGEFFPSVSAGWRIIDEDFMKKQTVFSDLKLRLGYGIAGNDVIPPYYTQSSLTLIPFSYDDSNAATSYGISSLIGNNDLQWETTATKNFGLDFGLLKNRITGTIDYYDAKTTHLIFPYTLPASTGVATINRNIGSTRNRGVEIAITSNNIKSKAFSWTTNVTFTKNHEEITALPNGNVIASDYRNSLIIGQPVKVFYDYKKIGIWQSSEAAQAATFGAVPGDVKIQDLSGPNGIPDGKIDQYDRSVIGTTVPKWSGGLNNDFSYKGFSLNVFLFARIGQWISSDYYGKYDPRAINNVPDVNYWTPDNPSNDFPSPNANKNTPYITALTLREASYLKLRSVTLGYTIPKAITEKYKINNLRIYASGRNLATISNIKDFDPEGGGGVDKPLSRVYVLGINLGL